MLSRDALEAALVEVNRRRAHHRRGLRTTELELGDRHRHAAHARAFARLTAAHAELAAELELVKAAEKTSRKMSVGY